MSSTIPGDTPREAYKRFREGGFGKYPSTLAHRRFQTYMEALTRDITEPTKNRSKDGSLSPQPSTPTRGKDGR